MELIKRLKTFVQLAYGGNITKFSKECGLKPSTVLRWLGDEQSDPQVSSLLTLEKAGLNLSWVMTGRGSMFSFNEKGKNFSNSQQVRNLVVERIHSLNVLEEIKNLPKLKTKGIPSFYTQTVDDFEKINKRADYLLINYFLINLISTINGVKFKQAINRYDDSGSHLDSNTNLLDEIKPYLSYFLAMLSLNIGPDIETILDEEIITGFLNDHNSEED